MAQITSSTSSVTTIGEDWDNHPINPQLILQAIKVDVNINDADLTTYPAIMFVASSDFQTRLVPILNASNIDHWVYASGDTATRDADFNVVNTIIGSVGGGGGSATWGTITGTLSDQLDLQAALDAKASVSHAPTHIHNGSDEIDGDKLDIDYTPTNYTRDTTPPEVGSVEELTAHLAGIDNALSGASSVFGSNTQYNESESTSTTTTVVWQPKVGITTPSLTSGNYIVYIYCEIANTSTSGSVGVRLNQNAGTILTEIKKEPKDNYDWLPVAGMKRVNVAGVQNFLIEFNQDGSGTASIRRARIHFYRES